MLDPATYTEMERPRDLDEQARLDADHDLKDENAAEMKRLHTFVDDQRARQLAEEKARDRLEAEGHPISDEFVAKQSAVPQPMHMSGTGGIALFVVISGDALHVEMTAESTIGDLIREIARQKQVESDQVTITSVEGNTDNVVEQGTLLADAGVCGESVVHAVVIPSDIELLFDMLSNFLSCQILICYLFIFKL